MELYRNMKWSRDQWSLGQQNSRKDTEASCLHGTLLTPPHQDVPGADEEAFHNSALAVFLSCLLWPSTPHNCQLPTSSYDQRSISIQTSTIECQARYAKHRKANTGLTICMSVCVCVSMSLIGLIKEAKVRGDLQNHRQLVTGYTSDKMEWGFALCPRLIWNSV